MQKIDPAHSASFASLRACAAAALIAAMAACGQNAPPEAAPIETAPAAVDAVTAQRITDLVAIHNALQAYRAANGQYPVTPDRGSFVSVVSAGENWIPGLAPQFLETLPRDPRGSGDASEQYWYASQGGSYKLIVHGVGEACGPHVEREGVRRDPARTGEDGSCWAYGFWSDDMARY